MVSVIHYIALCRNHTIFNVVASYSHKQRIFFRIGQVECLKTLLSEGKYRNAQYGLERRKEGERKRIHPL